METKVINKKKAEAAPKKAQSDRAQKKEAIERNIGAAVKAFEKFRSKPSY